LREWNAVKPAALFARWLLGGLLPRADALRSKNVVKVTENGRNYERKANKMEKNDSLRFVTTCHFRAGCVGSGKI